LIATSKQIRRTFVLVRSYIGSRICTKTPPPTTTTSKATAAFFVEVFVRESTFWFFIVYTNNDYSMIKFRRF
jgi:hypothetical protein